jgi:hypothetical protein
LQNDPTLDTLYGVPPVEPRQGKPPISRAMQLSDDFAPPAPPELAPTSITAPPAVVPPVPAPEDPTPAPAPVAAPNAAPEPPKEFTATVDLGDGTGPARGY